jgi:zinc/manganese transport system substrate-binding protein
MKPTWALILLGAAACAAHGDQARPDLVRVVTLNTVLTEIAREVGGSEVSVSGIVQPGVDPHSFNPSPADIAALVDADLVLASGLHLEAYLGRLVSSAGPRGRVVSVGDLVPLVLSTPGGQAGGGDRDPHWWHSIGNVIFAADVVRSELARLRPASADAFSRNAADYRRRLEALRSWALAEVARLPAGRRQLVTSHDAFGYLARDFGFTVHPVNGLSTESEADARHLAGLVDFIRAEKVRAVFVESSANPRLVRNLLEETGARLGGMLYADGLGPAGSGAEDYVSMYRHNISTIVGGLSAP